VEERQILNKLVFIAGALRSGTTVLHLMLRHVSGINHLGEWDFLFEHYPGCDKESFDVVRYRLWLKTQRTFLATGLIIDPSLNYKDLLRDFVRQREKQGQLTVINVHRNFHLIAELFPEAKVVHLLRDPRDVARSCMAMGWSGNTYYGVDFWMNSEDSWGRLLKTLRHEQYLELTFEQLIAATDDVIARICTFLELPFDPNYIEYADHSTYGTPDISLIEQWKRKMTTKEVQLIEYKLGALLADRGYRSSGYPKLHALSWLTKLTLAASDRAGQYRFGFNRYGMSLFLGEKVARWFLPGSLHDRLVLKKNAIDRTHLK